MRILSYNIQAAIHARSYFSYAWQWYKQILPSPAKRQTLRQIADFIRPFDLVCLQEIDLGGLRNGFQNHANELQQLGNFPYLLSQVNRKIGFLSLHGNLILSKIPLTPILNSPLPSRIPGRGVLAGAVTLSSGERLIVANVHLSLGKIDQHKQLRFIRNHLQNENNVLLTGDFNCDCAALPLNVLQEHGYRRLGDDSPTFPSWQPKKVFDHAFLKGNLHGHCAVKKFIASDHLPLQIEILAQKME